MLGRGQKECSKSALTPDVLQHPPGAGGHVGQEGHGGGVRGERGGGRGGEEEVGGGGEGGGDGGDGLVHRLFRRGRGFLALMLLLMGLLVLLGLVQVSVLQLGAVVRLGFTVVPRPAPYEPAKERCTEILKGTAKVEGDFATRQRFGLASAVSIRFMDRSPAKKP